jgi:heme exporter protein B
MKLFFRQVWLIVKKDLLAEQRSRETFSSMFFFSLLILVVFQFTLRDGVMEKEKLAAGMIWISILFSGMIGLARSFAQEYEGQGICGILLAPVDRGALYTAKTLTNLFFIFCVQIFFVPLLIIFFNINIITKLPLLIPLLILGIAGFAAVGTLISSITVHTQIRDVLLPIFLFPITIPVIIYAVSGTDALLSGGDGPAVTYYLKILCGIDTILFTVCYLLFDHTLTE